MDHLSLFLWEKKVTCWSYYSSKMLGKVTKLGLQWGKKKRLALRNIERGLRISITKRLELIYQEMHMSMNQALTWHGHNS